MQHDQRWAAAGAPIVHTPIADVDEMATDTLRSHGHPWESISMRNDVRAFSTCSAPPMLAPLAQMTTPGWPSLAPGGGQKRARLGIIGWPSRTY